jgi:2-desacetyl-2-hydroxyethyl bacteriochlorophyllide A dehydrogenase
VRAVRSTGDGVALVDVEPEVPEYASDPVRIRVRSAGICASDLKMLPWKLPVTMGHEFAGVLDDGTLVAVQPNAPCGTCALCLSGRDHLCAANNSRVHGIFTDGGLADEVIVDRSCLVALPLEVGPDVGALVEPVAVALHAAHQAGLHDESPPDRILVIGGGSIGLALVTIARHHGADVDLVARHPAQREAGERLGARLSPADEYDVVVECAGTQSSLDDAISRVRPGGSIVIPSSWFDPVHVGTTLLMKEPHVRMSYTYGHHHGEREFDEAAAVLAAHPELADAMITHRFPLDDAPEAFRTAADRAAGTIKVVIHP